MISKTIPQLLSEEQINMIAIANMLFDTAKEYSQRVNDELLSPIADLLNDPDFLSKHKVRIEDDIPNWAQYKRQSRNFNILIAQEALRLKRQQDKIRKDYLKRIAGLIPRSRSEPSKKPITSTIDLVSPIASLLSPQTKARMELHQEFDRAKGLPISLKIPWTAILSSLITEPTTLDAIPIICPESPRSDISAKLSTLLHMEMEGLISLNQIGPFSEISIFPQGIDPDGLIIIKNKHGIEKKIYWASLSDDERTDIIADINANKIVCIGTCIMTIRKKL